jgi:hypothetical protein
MTTPDAGGARRAGGDLRRSASPCLRSECRLSRTRVSHLRIHLRPRGTDEAGKTPEITPDLIRLGARRRQFCVAVHPGSLHAGRLRRTDVVLESEGNVDHVLRWHIELVQEPIKICWRWFVRAAVFRREDEIEGNLEMLQRMRDDIAISV